MINSEVLELKKRFRKEKNTFYRIAGCYVSDKKEKIYQFNKSFPNLPEDEIYKYLEIATKALSGKIQNNLLNVEFPVEEEKSGGSQDYLYKLRNSGASDEELLEGFYDKIIQNYQYLRNYLIVLFFDQYDVPNSTKDNADPDDTIDTYDYIICAICPVELSQPALGYIDQDTGLAITPRNLVVSAPDTGLLFPAFNDRTADIHSFLFYTKDAKSPHAEIIEDLFNCECGATSIQKKMMFDDIIQNQLSDIPEDEIADAIVDVEYRLNQMIEAHKADNGDAAILRMTDEVIQELIDDAPIDDDCKDGIITALTEIFEDTNTDASVLVSRGNLKIGEVRAEKQAIAHMLCEKEKELQAYKDGNITKQYERRSIDGIDYVLIPADMQTSFVDGKEYILIKATEI